MRRSICAVTTNGSPSATRCCSFAGRRTASFASRATIRTRSMTKCCSRCASARTARTLNSAAAAPSTSAVHVDELTDQQVEEALHGSRPADLKLPGDGEHADPVNASPERDRKLVDPRLVAPRTAAAEVLGNQPE